MASIYVSDRLREILSVFSDEEIKTEAGMRSLMPAASELSDSEIEAEYEERNLGTHARDFQALADAFYLGKTDEAMRMARDMAERATGRNLL